MRIEPSSGTRTVAGPEALGWRVTERRIVVVDGVSVQYEVSHMNTKDMNGKMQQYAAVQLRWPHGQRTVPATEFTAGMTDAALQMQVRHAMHEPTRALVRPSLASATR